MHTQLSYAAKRSDLHIGMLLAMHPELQIEQDDYNINVTANIGAMLTASEVLQKYVQHDGANQPAHLYFHVPLCSYICHFCNYVKRLLPNNGHREEVLDKWTSVLIDESQRYLDRAGWLRQAVIESFFIGGGTASLLRERHLGDLLEHVCSNYLLADNCELTLEGNPDNFQNGELKAAQKLGFNRFSVGVQSFQTEVNHFAGREHDREMSLHAIENLLESGCPFNVDMMFGLPYQSVESVEEDMRILVGLGVPTITIYRFRNAERHKMGIGNRAVWNIETVRDRLHKQGFFPLLEQTYAMREAVVSVLLDHSYQPSPCGWWSLPGTYPDGNIPRVSRNKWQRYNTMIAFGPGAYGWIAGENSTVIQTHNESDIASYLKRMESEDTPPLAFGRLLEANQAVASALGFAFKANQPIELERFTQKFGVNLLRDNPYKEVLETLLRDGFIEFVNDGTAFKPTLRGEALHEEIISVYLHGRIGCFSGQVCHKF